MALNNEHTQGSNVRGNYKKYTDDDRYKTGKYASENGSKNISTLVTEKRGRPLLLGKLDEMVQKYIKAASNRRAVISRSMGNATAKALLVRYPGVVEMIDVENSSRAKSLFQRMGYSRRKVTTLN